MAELSARPDIARANALKAVDIDLGKPLMRFAETHYGDQWIRDAFTAYLDREGEPLSDRDMPLDPVSVFPPASAKGLTLAEEWGRLHAKELTHDRRL